MHMGSRRSATNPSNLACQTNISSKRSHACNWHLLDSHTKLAYLHLLRGCNPHHARCYVGPNWILRLLRPGHLQHLRHLEGTASHLSCLQGFDARFDEPSETQTLTDLMSRGNNHCTKIATCCAWPWPLISGNVDLPCFSRCLDGSSFGAVFFPWSIWKVFPNELLQINGCQIYS